MNSGTDIRLNPLKVTAEPTPFGLSITIEQEEVGTKQQITIKENMVDSLCAALLQVKTKGLGFDDAIFVGEEK